MEVPGDNSDPRRRFRIQVPSLNTIRFPISTLLEHSGILSPTQSPTSPTNPNLAGDEVSISIAQDGNAHSRVHSGDLDCSNQLSLRNVASSSSLSSQGGSSRVVGPSDSEVVAEQTVDNSDNDTASQRRSIHQVARWLEQILPFSLLLLVVFIRQHLQGITAFIFAFWAAGIMYKSNDILKNQTALKGERKLSVLVGLCIVFTVHVLGVYWWFQEYKLLYQLIMLPPETIPPLWIAFLIVLVNDTLVRQAAMVFKCFLLMYYKNSRGRKYRRQGQILTALEYLFLLYRALLPTPVWYRFFLNTEYGSLFSSLITGVYLTLKLVCVFEKAMQFFTAAKALSRQDMHYGLLATSEQVAASGDLCAICQEKIHIPIFLHCKHIFCEDCVSEWFERERTCPLCRTIVKPDDLKSYSDGSTSMFFQLC